MAPPRWASKLAVVALGAVIASGAVPPARAAGRTVTVEVRDVRFSPQDVEIDVGDTVEWLAIDGGHTVTSDDRTRADFRFPSGRGTLNAGDTGAFTFTEAGVYTYHCELHGTPGNHPNGMTGAIYVDVEPPPPPTPTVLSVPSENHPTIGDAVSDAVPGTLILVEPGTYPLRDPLALTVDRVTLRPNGAGPVVLQPAAGSQVEYGILVAANRIAIEDLTLRDFPASGIVVDEARDVRLDRVVVEGGRHGLHLRWADSGGINAPQISGTTVAGILIEDCLDQSCPHVLGGRIAVAAGAGVAIRGGGVAAVREVTVEASGTGIEVQGMAGASVASNSVSAETGIAVHGPSTNVQVLHNRLSADIGIRWDLLGANVCFRGNTDDTGAEPSSSPPGVQLLFPCR